VAPAKAFAKPENLKVASVASSWHGRKASAVASSAGLRRGMAGGESYLLASAGHVAG